MAGNPIIRSTTPIAVKSGTDRAVEPDVASVADTAATYPRHLPIGGSTGASRRTLGCVRTNGQVSRGSGLGVNDHVCWTYDDDTAFMTAGREWLADGQVLRQRLMFVSGWSESEMRERLDGFPGADELIAAGHLVLVSIPALYDLTQPIVPEQQLATYA